MIDQKNWKRNVTLFIVGQTITLFGSMIVQYAILWHITLTTQSGAMITLITLIGFVPMFIIAPFGGVWADRYNRKLLINISDSVVALASLFVGACLFLGYDHIAILLACTGVRALGQGVQMPAVNAAIPQIVPAENLTKVNGVYQSVTALSTLASPLLGALLMSLFPLYTLFFFDVITATIGISMLFFLVKVPSLQRDEKKEKINYFHDIKEGLRYIRGHKFVLRLMIFSAFFYIFMSPASLLTPLQVVRKFGDDVWRLSAIEVAFFVGMMLGGGIIALWGGFKNKVVTTAFGCILFGVSVVGLGIVPNVSEFWFWIYLGVFVVCGIVVPILNTPIMTLLQTKVEPEFMGRVLSVFTMLSTSIMPLTMLVYGPLVDIEVDNIIDIVLIVTGVMMMLASFGFVINKTLYNAGKISVSEKVSEEN